VPEVSANKAGPRPQQAQETFSEMPCMTARATYYPMPELVEYAIRDISEVST
jgi:hypothetical protein